MMIREELFDNVEDVRDENSQLRSWRRVGLIYEPLEKDLN